MSAFGIRPTYKPRFNPFADDGTPVYAPDQEETKKIIEAIQRFKSKSAHSSIQNLAELQTVLGKSSINPEHNPMAREGVEKMLRGKANREADAPIEDIITSGVDMEPSGFSSLSVGKHQNRAMISRMEKELQKELEEIKAESLLRRQIGVDLPGLPESAPSEATPEQNMKEDVENEDDEDEEDLQITDPLTGAFTSNFDPPGMNRLQAATAMPLPAGFGMQPIVSSPPFHGMNNPAGRHPTLNNSHPNTRQAAGQVNTPVKSSGEKAPRNPELAMARKMLSVGYPARAASIRGFSQRHSGMAGCAIRKTPTGIADGF